MSKHDAHAAKALRPSLHDLRDQLSGMVVPVLLAVGDEDVHCLETNLMLKSAASQRWSHGSVPIPATRSIWKSRAAFNAQVENFLGAVERGSCRHGFPRTEVDPSLGLYRRACRDNSLIRVNQERANADVVCFAPHMMALSRVQARPPHETQSWRLSLRSKWPRGWAEAAKRPKRHRSQGSWKQRLDRFLGSDDDVGDTATVARRLSGLSRQLEQLDRNLRIANETVALHADSISPLFAATAGGRAAVCIALGAERFEEFAAQVGRRVDLGVPLIQETVDRGGAVGGGRFARDLARLESLGSRSTVYQPGLPASTAVDDASAPLAAVREDGSRGLSRPYGQRSSLMPVPPWDRGR